MPRNQPIQPQLEDGIDRKVLTQLRQRFLTVNAGRLERALEAMSTRQRRVLRLLPLLLHVNHPALPGYVSATTPAGLHGFEPDDEQLAEATGLSRSFAYKGSRARAGRDRSPRQIHGLFLMGSLGTLAQAERSDLDVWVCHDPSLPPAAVSELERKCQALSQWAAGQGAEAHFFLIDPLRFARGERNERLSGDNCGSSQHYLLLDEFYRTAVWLGGRVLLWWLVPAYEEHRYEAYVAALLDKRFVQPDEVLDLGHLHRIPPQEFLGAGLWQLYKGIGSPYKSLLKLLLTEVYASEHPHLECLALRFKAAVYANRLDLDELDPYLMVYRRLEAYLLLRGERERLELVRRSLYLKVEKKLSRPPGGLRKSWQRLLLERLTGDWGWSEAQLIGLDKRYRWKVDEVGRERRALVGELIYSFRFLSEFARQQQVGSPLDSRDLAVLGRQLYATFERKAGKVDWINPGISPDMSEEAVTLVVGRDSHGERLWSLYRGSLPLRQCRDFAPLRRAREPMTLLAWCHRNGVIDPATRVSLHPGDSDLSEAELSAVLVTLRQFLPLPLPPTPDEALLAPSVPRQMLLLVNVGLDPAQTAPAEAGDAGQAPGGTLLSLDELVLNSWNELMVNRYEGPTALIDALQAFVLAADGGRAPVELLVRCHCRHRDPGLARRLEELLLEARSCLAVPGGGRYLMRWQSQFHLLESVDGRIRHTPLADLPALIEQLGQPRAAWGPLSLHRRALPGHPLELVLPLGHPDAIGVFYRIDGEQAELMVLDERNTLWLQRVAFRDLATLLTPLWRFLRSVLFRRAAQLPLGESSVDRLQMSWYEVFTGAPGQPAGVVRRHPPQPAPGSPYYDVQAIVQRDDRGLVQVVLYCDQQEFSQLELGEELYQAVARHILARRAGGERYPCYLTDLDISAVLRDGAHTVQYLRYKTRLERLLNQALAQLA